MYKDISHAHQGCVRALLGSIAAAAQKETLKATRGPLRTARTGLPYGLSLQATMV